MGNSSSSRGGHSSSSSKGVAGLVFNRMHKVFVGVEGIQEDKAEVGAKDNVAAEVGATDNVAAAVNIQG